jgi:hypothetical protein
MAQTSQHPGEEPMLAGVAEELAYDEQAHVKLLRKALRRYAIAKPALALQGERGNSQKREAIRRTSLSGRRKAGSSPAIHSSLRRALELALPPEFSHPASSSLGMPN